MNILCRIFGHKPWHYRELVPSGYDGIDRHHGMLYARCDRCGIKYHEGNAHIPDEKIIKLNKRIKEMK